MKRIEGPRMPQKMQGQTCRNPQSLMDYRGRGTEIEDVWHYSFMETHKTIQHKK